MGGESSDSRFKCIRFFTAFCGQALYQGGLCGLSWYTPRIHMMSSNCAPRAAQTGQTIFCAYHWTALSPPAPSVTAVGKHQASPVQAGPGLGLLLSPKCRAVACAFKRMCVQEVLCLLFISQRRWGPCTTPPPPPLPMQSRAHYGGAMSPPKQPQSDGCGHNTHLLQRMKHLDAGLLHGSVCWAASLLAAAPRARELPAPLTAEAPS